MGGERDMRFVEMHASRRLALHAHCGLVMAGVVQRLRVGDSWNKSRGVVTRTKRGGGHRVTESQPFSRLQMADTLRHCSKSTGAAASWHKIPLSIVAMCGVIAVPRRGRQTLEATPWSVASSTQGA